MLNPNDHSGQGQARILTNTTYLLAASVIQKFVSFGYFIYIARSIGSANLGLFEPVRSVIPISLVVVDFALSVVLTREVARARERAQHYLNVVLTLKVLFALATLFITLGVVALVDFDPLTRTLLFFVGLIVALDMFTMSYVATLRGLQVFKYEAIGIVVTQVLTTIVGVVGLNLKLGLPWLMVALLAGSLVNFSYLLAMVKRRFGAFPRLSWDPETMKRFLGIALPILGAQLPAKFFTYTDRFLLLSLAGKTASGIYLAAHRIPFALEFIPAAFAASLLPAMSTYYLHSRDQLISVFHRALRYLLIISVPLTVGIFVLAKPLVVKLLARPFVDSVEPLSIMVTALPLIFLNFPVGHFLIATNRQIWNTINMAIAVATNVLMNLLLIPKLGANGAATAVVVSYAVLFSLNMVQVRRVIPLQAREIMTVALHTMAAGIIMAIPLIFLRSVFAPYFLILPGAAVYFAALFVFGAVGSDDVRLVLRALGKKG